MLVHRSVQFAILAVIFSLPVLAVDWSPIDPADLALKQSRTDPNADAEALFREVRVLNEQRGFSYAKNLLSEYVRLKIFTDRGLKFGDVQIPYFRDQSVFDVQGRTIHPDGSIVELGKDSVFEKVIEKRGFKTRVVSFAMPAVQPGSIIEFRFTKNEGERSFRYRQLEVQSLYPVDRVTFIIKPLGVGNAAYPPMRYMPFGCSPEHGQSTREGYDVITVKDVPAFHEEPYSPPEFSAKQWILIYYEDNDKTGREKYWTALGKQRYREYSDEIKVNGEIKQLAAELTTGATTDGDKLDKILAYCRKNIKDVRGDNITTAELEKAKANKTTVDTIRRREGDATDIVYAFIALAQAAGFDARMAEMADRSTFLFGPVMQAGFFLNAFDAAVNVGGSWRFYDVTNPAVPGGELRWQEQGVYALVLDPKEPEMVRTPMLMAQESSASRAGVFTISADGVLEGEVREILAGNQAIEWRERNRHTNDTQREEALRDHLKQRFADFDLTNAKFTANENAAMPVGITYHLVVRGYAQRTGKRLFVQPSYFTFGFNSRFPEATRYNNVYFDYPWSESDSVDLTLPPGFELDHGDAPAGISIPPTCTYTVHIGINKATNQIQYHRNLVFGNKDLLIFDAKIYANLKQVFDRMHEGDNHALSFKAVTASGEASPND